VAVTNPNDFERLYSQCENSSEWNNDDPRPRTCSLGLYDGTVVWQQCAKCNSFRQAFDEPNAVQELLKRKSRPNTGGCSKCKQKNLEQSPLPRNSRKFVRKKSEGLGDTIAKITRFFGFKPCSACEKRRRAMNKKVPYGLRLKNFFSNRSRNNQR